MKNTNLDNTIRFIDKKAEYKGKNHHSRLNLKNLKNKNNKVIKYQERKKIKEYNAIKKKFKNSKLYKSRKIILTISIFLFSLLFIVSLLNKFYDPSPESTEFTNFKSENYDLSKHEASTYMDIIKESVQGTLNIKSKVVVEELHKNGNLVFAQGYFNIPDKGYIYYDMILKNYKPYSLKVNGQEFIKK